MSPGGRLLTILLMGVLLLLVAGCSGFSPRDRWFSEPERSPHIFSTWTGGTAMRIVYDYDGNPMTR